MEGSFFRTRALWWSFWANIIFILGMAGYLLMDGLDYMRPNALSSSLAAGIYVLLAGVFVVHAMFQILSLYHTNSSTHRYYVMVLSCTIDKIASDAFCLGALLAATSFASFNTIWTCNTIGVVGFALAALLNMLIRGPSMFYTWANLLNLVGSLLYVVATFITLGTITQITIILGDIIYLIDAVLYTICWFSDRQTVLVVGEQTVLVNK